MRAISHHFLPCRYLCGFLIDEGKMMLFFAAIKVYQALMRILLGGNTICELQTRQTRVEAILRN
jgi:hypothetical protein